MKQKLILYFLIALTLQAPPRKLRSRHHKKIRHHRRFHNRHHHKNQNHRRLHHNIIPSPLTELNAATKLGFEEGLQYAKKHKTRNLNYEDDLEDVYDDEAEHHYHRTMGGVGAAAFLGGTVSRHNKHKHGKSIEKIMKDQFAFKDGIINIVSKEIQDLRYLNQKLSSAGRRIGSTESNVMQRLQEKVFELYTHKGS